MTTNNNARIYQVHADKYVFSETLPSDIFRTIEKYQKKCKALLSRASPEIAKILTTKITYLQTLLDWKDPKEENTPVSPSFYSREERIAISKAKSGIASIAIKKQKEEQRAAVLDWLQKGTMDISEERGFHDLFDVIERAKIIVFYNDQIRQGKTNFPPIQETGVIPIVRNRIEKWEKEKSRLSAFIRFVTSMKFGAFTNKDEFLGKCRDMLGYDTFDTVDWRDSPFIIQYAVGDNDKIPNPYRSDTSSVFCIDRFDQYTRDLCNKKKYEPVLSWIRTLKSRMASLSKTLPQFDDLDTSHPYL